MASAEVVVVATGIEGLTGLVERSRRSFLFCLDRSRQPVGYAMNVMQCRAGALWFTTYTKSAKVSHLTAAPQACCLVVDESAPATRWCSVEGRATVARATTDDVDKLFAAFADRRVPEAVLAKVRSRLHDGRRSLIRLDLDRPDDVTVLERRVGHGH